MALVCDDEYCERVWNDYERALRIIEQYKDSPVEDIAFLCEYCEMIINENFKEQEENNKRFKVINLLTAERNDYIQYTKWLERRVSYLSHHEYDDRIKYYKEKHIDKDFYDKRYNENKLNWTDITRRN